jgi:MFS superfamily sulfate permease-like transporter
VLILAIALSALLKLHDNYGIHIVGEIPASIPSFIFANAPNFSDLVEVALKQSPDAKVLLIDAEPINYVDVTAIDMLNELYDTFFTYFLHLFGAIFRMKGCYNVDRNLYPSSNHQRLIQPSPFSMIPVFPLLSVKRLDYVTRQR